MNGNINSSIQELHEALKLLCPLEDGSFNFLPNEESGHGPGTPLNDGVLMARYISNNLRDVNPSLSEAWTKVESVTRGIESKIEDCMLKYVKELQKFIENTYENENMAIKAAQAANEAAERILKDLDLN